MVGEGARRDITKVSDGFIVNHNEGYFTTIKRLRRTFREEPATKGDIRKYKMALTWKLATNIVPEKIKVSVGARVMLLRSIDAQNKLVNGSIGVVEGFKWIGDDCNLDDHRQILTKILTAVVVKFRPFEWKEQTVDIIRRLAHTSEIEAGSLISMYQFPLELA